MLKIINCNYSDLTKGEKEEVSDSGYGKEEASYIKVIHNNNVIAVYSDAMEPEDATFCRDLSWINSILKVCYDIGLTDCK